jgi:hypothetical protein
MAELKKDRNTDVPGSIAGYYYQILLACREISQYGIVEEVGVETGADVNVVSVSKEILNIEAKFHMKNFGKYAEDIVKTIFNFYTSYEKNVKKFIFSTNVSPTKECKEFFENWGKNGNEIRYIKECILLKSVECESKEVFEQFCNEQDVKNEVEKGEKTYIKVLIEETLGSGTGKFQYGDFAVINPLITYEDFAKLLHFSFACKKKQDLVSKIRDDIKENINNTLASLGMKHLEREESDLVINKLIDCFLEKILQNSQSKCNNRVKSEEYVNIVKNYKSIEEKHIFKYKIFSCIQLMQEEELLVLQDIRKRAPVEDIDILEENYKCIQEMILCKISTTCGYDSFANTYTLKSINNINVAEILIKIVYILTIIMSKEKLAIEDVEFIFDQGINNIKLQNVMECSFKKTSSNAYRRMEEILGELICKFHEDTNINENQIFIIDADYRNKGKPCESLNLMPEVYDITQSDENFKDYQMFYHMNYKCTKCLDIDDVDGYDRFKCGGGNLCKKI